MSDNVSITEAPRSTIVLIRLDCYNSKILRSKVLKDAARELQKEIAAQISRED